MKNLRLGEILMEAGTIDRQQLEAALAYQQSHRDLPIGQARSEEHTSELQSR